MFEIRYYYKGFLLNKLKSHSSYKYHAEVNLICSAEKQTSRETMFIVTGLSMYNSSIAASFRVFVVAASETQDFSIFFYVSWIFWTI